MEVLEVSGEKKYPKIMGCLRDSCGKTGFRVVVKLSMLGFN